MPMPAFRRLLMIFQHHISSITIAAAGYGPAGGTFFHLQKVFINAEMPDCPASGHSGTGINKMPMPEPVRYRNKGTQLGTRGAPVPVPDLDCWMSECRCRCPAMPVTNGLLFSSSVSTVFFSCVFIPVKGTQAWEFFGLWFWNLYFFVVSYAEMLRFCWKNFFIGPLLGEIGLFCVYSDYAEQTNFGELGKKFFNFSNLKRPLYIC